MTAKPLALLPLAATVLLLTLPSNPVRASDAGEVNARVREAFAVFRRDATAADQIPKRLRESTSPAEQARTRRVGGRAARMWVTATSGDVCTLVALSSRGSAQFGGCGPANLFARDGGIAWTVIRGGTRVSALVPDGFRRYRLVFNDRVRPIKPRHNGFSIPSRTDPLAVTYITADGVKKRTPNPLLVARQPER